MLKRVTTWLAGLAFIAGLRKFFMSAGRAARSNRFALPSRQRRSMMPWQRRRFMFPWQRRVSRMNTFRPLLLGLGLGAVLMYLFDARLGNRRRALVRDQAIHMTHVTEDALGKTSRDVKNRATGVMAEMQKGPGEGNGAGQASGRVSSPELAQENWSPATRMLGGFAGTALAASTFAMGGLPRVAGGAVGLGLLARSVTNFPVKRLVGVGAGRRAVDVQKTINIGAPVEEVFNFYSNFENFPRFMANVREVRDLGEGRSHWVVEGPAGISAQWNATITRFEPDRLIAWRSDEDSMVGNAGTVRFDPAPNGGTRLTVRMSYNPPAGAVGHAVATVFNSNPKQAMDEDLLRLKSLIETGKTSAGEWEVRREELQPRQDAEPRRREAGGQVQSQLGGRQGERSVELTREPGGEDTWGSRRGELPPGGEIPREQWEQFCKTFGQLYAGWLVRVETHYPDGSESTIATDQPLLELSNEHHDGGFDLRLVLGSDATETLAHNITNVESLHLQTNAEGGHEELQVRSADGTTTVRFRSPGRA